MCASEHSHPSPTEEFCPARLLDVHSEPIRLVDYHDIQKAARKNGATERPLYSP
jgi:hypothetical protein